jgi:hypothetical protein
MSGAIPPLHHTPSYPGQWKIYPFMYSCTERYIQIRGKEALQYLRNCLTGCVYEIQNVRGLFA